MWAQSGEENKDETDWVGNGGVAGQRGNVCGAGCGTGGAGGESSDYDGEESVDALREKHGGGRGLDAGGEIWLQADSGDELVWACGDAHRAVELFFVREDFGADGAGVQTDGRGWEGQTGGGVEGVV